MKQLMIIGDSIMKGVTFNGQKYQLICLNDNVHIRGYESVMGNLDAAFHHILPEKSSFEI